MCFSNDIDKSKRTNKVLLTFLIIFFVGSTVLGYLYYKKNNAYKTLSSNKQTMEQTKNQEISALKKQIEDNNITANNDLKNENDDLKKQISALNDQNDAYKDKIANANLYNEFLKYLNSVIQTHNGFTGWTDAEFQIAKGKAEATGDTAFVSIINEAWYATSTPAIDRLIRGWNAIASGIENALK